MCVCVHVRSTLWVFFNLVYCYWAWCQLTYNRSLCRKGNDPNGYKYANVLGMTENPNALYHIQSHDLPWEVLPARVSLRLVLNPYSQLYMRDFQWTKQKQQQSQQQSNGSPPPKGRLEAPLNQRLSFLRGRRSNTTSTAMQRQVSLPPFVRFPSSQCL